PFHLRQIAAAAPRHLPTDVHDPQADVATPAHDRAVVTDFDRRLEPKSPPRAKFHGQSWAEGSAACPGGWRVRGSWRGSLRLGTRELPVQLFQLKDEFVGETIDDQAVVPQEAFALTTNVRVRVQHADDDPLYLPLDEAPGAAYLRTVTKGAGLQRGVDC